jgi:hypothetical protein
MSALNSRLDKLRAALNSLHPPRQLPYFDAAALYGKTAFEEGEELDEADALNRLCNIGDLTVEECEAALAGELDVTFIRRVIVDPPIYPANATPPRYDSRPLLRSITLPADDATAERRVRERPTPIDYPPGHGYDDTKI